MKRIANLAILTAVLALGGCAGLIRQTPTLGDPMPVVLSKMGQPTAIYPFDGGQELEYATGPMGQFTYMARIGPDGRLVSYEQVLTGEKFAMIRIDKATKDDVLRTIGRPAEYSTVALRGGMEVWSYRYKESGVWNSMMHVHFDGAGVVRLMQNGPDPMYDDRRRSFW